MLHRTQEPLHLARYDAHLGRRFHQAIKQLAYLRDSNASAARRIQRR